jgi:hypothetical protein
MGKSNRFGFCDISLWFSSYIICVMVWRKSHRFSFSEICVMALVKYVLTWPFWKFVWWHQKNHTIFFSWTDLCDLKPLITHVTGTGGPKSHGCCIDRPFFWNRRGKSPTDVCMYMSIPYQGVNQYSIPKPARTPLGVPTVRVQPPRASPLIYSEPLLGFLRFLVFFPCPVFFL